MWGCILCISDLQRQTKHTYSCGAPLCAPAGAGGNPTAKPTSSDSYSLWMQQPLRPTDSVTAQLACQLECAKEQLQRYADLAEAAQLQAASTVEQATQHVSTGN